MHSVAITPIFDRQAERAGLSEEDAQEMVAVLAANPLAGDLMPGTGGARKVRFPRKGERKSGGYRTVHYYGGDDVPLYLLALIDKRRAPNLSKAERNAIAVLLSGIISTYRASQRARKERAKDEQVRKGTD